MMAHKQVLRISSITLGFIFRLKLCFFVLLLPLTATSQSNKSNKEEKDNFTTIMSTKFDFDATGISASGKNPDGTFFQGRKSQSLNQMVKLRPDFRRELRNSRFGVRQLSN